MRSVRMPYQGRDQIEELGHPMGLRRIEAPHGPGKNEQTEIWVAVQQLLQHRSRLPSRPNGPNPGECGDLLRWRPIGRFQDGMIDPRARQDIRLERPDQSVVVRRCARFQWTLVAVVIDPETLRHGLYQSSVIRRRDRGRRLLYPLVLQAVNRPLPDGR